MTQSIVVILHFSARASLPASPLLTRTFPFHLLCFFMGSNAVLYVSATFWAIAVLLSLLLHFITSFATPVWWYVAVYGIDAALGWFVHFAGHRRWVRVRSRLSSYVASFGSPVHADIMHILFTITPFFALFDAISLFPSSLCLSNSCAEYSGLDGTAHTT